MNKTHTIPHTIPAGTRNVGQCLCVWCGKAANNHESCLSDEQREALARFAKSNGRRWKSELAKQWADGTCFGILQQVRNNRVGRPHRKGLKMFYCCMEHADGRLDYYGCAPIEADAEALLSRVEDFGEQFDAGVMPCPPWQVQLAGDRIADVLRLVVRAVEADAARQYQSWVDSGCLQPRAGKVR